MSVIMGEKHTLPSEATEVPLDVLSLNNETDGVDFGLGNSTHDFDTSALMTADSSPELQNPETASAQAATPDPYTILSIGFVLWVVFFGCCRRKVPDRQHWRGEQLRERALRNQRQQQLQEEPSEDRTKRVMEAVTSQVSKEQT